MRILWVKSDFLHPTNRGGQIRTLEMLRCLHQRNEVHYVAFREPGESLGVDASHEYCAHAYPVDFHIAPKTSLRFRAQVMASIFDPVPAAVGRFRSGAMKATIARLLSEAPFDSVVCDFLVPWINLPATRGTVLFQHNVESVIWRRRAEHASNAATRVYLNSQADRMFRFEKTACRRAAAVVAVSPVDAKLMRELYGAERVFDVPTGVNIEYFAPPEQHPHASDLVFIGSMDWAPNIDGVGYFAREILPLIWRKRSDCRFTIVGRDPTPEVRRMAEGEPRIRVTGTVDDVRTHLWGSMISVVPLRIGGGTRLKIYESMAARVPVVSTRIGAEGLVAAHPAEIRLADDPAEFAGECLALMDDASARQAISTAAWTLVRERFSWQEVARQFEDILTATQAAGHML